MKQSFFVDLHSHITLYPYNMGNENTKGMLYCKNPKIKEDIAPNYTQSDVEKMANGGVRIVFASLYPVEIGFMKIKGSEACLADDVIKLMTSFPKERIQEIQSPNHSYFEDLKKEYDFLMSSNNKELKVGNKSITYKIVSNYTELTQFLNINSQNELLDSSNKIAVILTIEGGHSLLPKTTEALRNVAVNDLSNKDTQQLLQTIKENIVWVKSKKVFAITFAHHFYNYLCGQSISFTKKIDWMLDQEDKSRTAFTALGVEVLKEMMNTSNGQRPLIIDVKHLSVASRIWFYAQDFTQNIPVIASHTSVNGYEKMELSTVNNDTHTAAQKKYNESTDFNNWDLNLSDEEIIIIARRKGLIGLSVDQRIIMGKSRLSIIKSKNFINILSQKKKDKEWCFPVFDTIMHIAKVLSKVSEIKKEDIWNTMTLGSDYDGLINPMNSYRTVLDYSTLQENLLLWFKESITKYDVLKGKSDSELELIVSKIMNGNSLEFLKQNFK